MPGVILQLRRFFRFEGVSMNVVFMTLFISYILQINSIISGQPLYMIALVTLLPWIPLALFEGVWKVKNYSIIAVLGLFTILQVGHFAEHVIQVVQLNVLNGTVACPPPIDNLENAKRGFELGLRKPGIEPSYSSASQIVKPGPDGFPKLDPTGKQVAGPAACAVFGQLDLEVVHLVWELIGYIGTAAVLLYFPRNKFLMIAFLCLSWHALEHLTITYFYYFDQIPAWPGFRQLWATVPGPGSTFIAVPAGRQETLLNFYDAGGKFGLMAKNGMFELLTGFKGMPVRPELHMGYNLLITIPTVIGFLIELKGLRSRYLEQTFSDLSSKQIANLSMRVDDVAFAKGQVILTEGDVATDCYLIKEGAAEVYISYGAPDQRLIAEVGSGSLVGEMGLLEHKMRSATVVAKSNCQCLRFSAELFAELTNTSSGEFQSDATLKKIQKIVQMRHDFNSALA
jgi:hypothetical protein